MTSKSKKIMSAEEIGAVLRERVKDSGAQSVADSLDISRETLFRLMAGAGVRKGTIYQVSAKLSG